jgi:hypothetical protein
VVVGLKDNWPELFGFISSLDGNTSAAVSMINSCFVSVGFWIFMIFWVFAKTFNVGLGAPLRISTIGLQSELFSSHVVAGGPSHL